jgi:hypothetical protein
MRQFEAPRRNPDATGRFDDRVRARHTHTRKIASHFAMFGDLQNGHVIRQRR